MITSSILTGFSFNFLTYCITRFLTGYSSDIAYVSGTLLVLELIGPDIRSSIGLAIEVFVALGYIFISLFHFFIKDWHFLLKSLAVIHLPTLLFIKFIPESPRFLICKGKIAEAEKIMNEIADKNGRAKVDLKVLEKITENNNSANSEENQDLYTVLDLFKNGWRMIIVLLINLFGMLICAAAYWSLSLSGDKLTNYDIHINTIAGGLIEFPAIILAIYLTRHPKIGLCIATSSCQILGGLCCILNSLPIFLELHWEWMDWDLFRFIVGISGKLFITSGVIIMFYYSTELFPTQVRGNALGLASMFSQLGGILSPWFMRLDSGVALSLIGSMIIIMGFLSFLLPETQGMPFLMSIEEATAFYKRSFKQKFKKFNKV